jgi:hypothetical protein
MVVSKKIQESFICILYRWCWGRRGLTSRHGDCSKAPPGSSHIRVRQPRTSSLKRRGPKWAILSSSRPCASDGQRPHAGRGGRPPPAAGQAGPRNRQSEPWRPRTHPVRPAPRPRRLPHGAWLAQSSKQRPNTPLSHLNLARLALRPLAAASRRRRCDHSCRYFLSAGDAVFRPGNGRISLSSRRELLFAKQRTMPNVGMELFHVSAIETSATQLQPKGQFFLPFSVKADVVLFEIPDHFCWNREISFPCQIPPRERGKCIRERMFDVWLNQL